jgi:hypothetical protein
LLGSQVKKWQLILAGLLCWFWAVECIAQEVTPRLFWPAPKGTKVFVAGYAYTTGDVHLDSSIPLLGSNARSNTGLLAYTQTLNLWGRTSNFLIQLPYSHGVASGLFNDEPVNQDFSAFGDLSATLNINLKGAPTLDREKYMAFRADPQTIVGASLKLVFPTGQYDKDRLVNVGANRWAGRLKIGTVLILKPSWLLELAASAWYFGDDDDFVTGKKEQAPVYSAETSLIKRIRPGLWASLDVTYYVGGQQTIDGTPLKDSQRNIRIGGTFVFPFRQRHAIKIGYVNGVVTRFGSDFDQLLLSYQVRIR